jgi:hypothetical protein
VDKILEALLFAVRGIERLKTEVASEGRRCVRSTAVSESERTYDDGLERRMEGLKEHFHVGNYGGLQQVPKSNSQSQTHR